MLGLLLDLKKKKQLILLLSALMAIGVICFFIFFKPDIEVKQLKKQSEATPSVAGASFFKDKEKIQDKARFLAAVRLLEKTRLNEQSKREEEYMKELRGNCFFQDPNKTLQMVIEGNKRYQDSKYTPERNWYLVRALVEMKRFNEAVEKSRMMIDLYPETFFAQDVARHLLTHPLGQPQ